MHIESLISEEFLKNLQLKGGGSALGEPLEGLSGRFQTFSGSRMTCGFSVYLVPDEETEGLRVVQPSHSRSWSGVEFIRDALQLGDWEPAVNAYVRMGLQGNLRAVRDVENAKPGYAPWYDRRTDIQRIVDKALTDDVQERGARFCLSRRKMWDFRTFFGDEYSRQNRHICGLSWGSLMGLRQLCKLKMPMGFKVDESAGLVLHRTPGVPSAMVLEDVEGKRLSVSFELRPDGKFEIPQGCLGLDALFVHKRVIAVASYERWVQLELTWRLTNFIASPFIWASRASLLQPYAHSLDWLAEGERDVLAATATTGSRVFGPMESNDPDLLVKASAHSSTPRAFLMR